MKQLKLAYRSLKKNGLFSVLNLIGLSVGSASFLLIILFVLFERSYEDFVPNGDRIYRVALKQYSNGELALHTTENYPAVGSTLHRELPEVESFARLYNLGYKNNVIITYQPAIGESISLRQRNFLYADSSFLELMGYEMLFGNASDALARPFNAVITERMANAYFGDENPIGKSLRMQDDDGNDELCTVTGVIKDVPKNSHLQFDVLFSYSTLYTRYEAAKARYNESWGRNDMYTYIRLTESTSPDYVEEKFDEIASIHSESQDRESGRYDEIELQPLRSIHLHSNIAEEQQTNGNFLTVNIMLAIAIFIALLAIINYVNLSTASFMDRANEVGIRKVLGAGKASIAAQFLLEVILMVIVSMLISIVLVILCLPLLSSIASTEFDLSALGSSDFLLIALTLMLGITLLSGIYPALSLSKYGIVETLKGKVRNFGSGKLLRNGLIVFQFVISLMLITGAFLVRNQISFLINQDIGLRTDQMLIVERPGITPKDPEAKGKAIQSFKNQLRSLSGVSNVTASLTIPGKKREYKSPFKIFGNPDEDAAILRWNSMDFDFIDTYEMELLAGRGFSMEYPGDIENSAILTKSAAEALRLSPGEALGKTVMIVGSEYKKTVVGVVNDYHQESLKKAVDPIIFVCSPSWDEYYSLSLSSRDIRSTLDDVEAVWSQVFPGNPFDYFFLDDFFNRQYTNETKLLRLISVFSVIIIILTCLGLFGLSVYTVRQRRKEMAIRKSIGASEGSIFFLMGKSYLILVAYSIVFALPIIWYLTNSWYEDFAYRTSINWVYVLLGLGIVCFITIASISQQAYVLAKSNPVKALKEE